MMEWISFEGKGVKTDFCVKNFISASVEKIEEKKR
jgi:hypothetical protein